MKPETIQHLETAARNRALARALISHGAGMGLHSPPFEWVAVVMSRLNRVSLVLTPQPEGGYTVMSPTLPGLVSEGDSHEQALANAEDALHATLELYEDTGRPIPGGLLQDPRAGAIQFDLAAVRLLGIEWEQFVGA